MASVSSNTQIVEFTALTPPDGPSGESKGCEGGQVWEECAHNCTRTCDDPYPKCDIKCVRKCECPEDRHIFNNGYCIKQKFCPAKREPGQLTHFLLDWVVTVFNKYQKLKAAKGSS